MNPVASHADHADRATAPQQLRGAPTIHASAAGSRSATGLTPGEGVVRRYSLDAGYGPWPAVPDRCLDAGAPLTPNR